MPWDIEIDVSDFAEACEQGDRLLRDLTLDAVTLAAKEGLAEAKARRTYRDRTGNLTRTAYERLLRVSRTEAEAEIGWPMPYAGYVEGGTRPHTITARRAGALAFPGSGGGTVVRRSVNHPGMAPRPFAGLAYEKAERVMQREVDKSVAALNAILGR